MATVAFVAACSDSSGLPPAGGPTTTGGRVVVTTVGAVPTTGRHDPIVDVAPAPSPRCGDRPADPTPPGGGLQDITLDGRPGAYHRQLPPAYDGATPVPLVLDLHGYSETVDVEVKISGFVSLGDTYGFITIVPTIYAGVPHWDDSLGSPDLRWLGLLLDHLESTLCVDEQRVYVTGFSNGAFMTSAMGCQFPDRIAAIAPNAGLRDPAGCDQTRPVPVLAFHGTADSVVSYDGGFGPWLAGQTMPDGAGTMAGVLPGTGPSIVEMATAWADRNGCADGAPAEERVTEHVARLAFDCSTAGEVEVIRIDGGGHSWPGVPNSGEKPTTEISAAAVAWEFFVNHPLVAG